MAFYKWDEVEELELDSGDTRRVVSGDKLMMFRNFLPKGSVPPRHRHESEQIAYIVSGAVKFWLGEEERIMRADELAVVPSNVEHGAEAVEDSVILAIFTPIREEWLRKTQ